LHGLNDLAAYAPSTERRQASAVNVSSSAGSNASKRRSLKAAGKFRWADWGRHVLKPRRTTEVTGPQPGSSANYLLRYRPAGGLRSIISECDRLGLPGISAKLIKSRDGVTERLATADVRGGNAVSSPLRRSGYLPRGRSTEARVPRGSRGITSSSPGLRPLP
jgi:hypothetical protein